MEASLQDEESFVEFFCSGETKDIIDLDVSGEKMSVRRSTLMLMLCPESSLARQFDDAAWTQQPDSDSDSDSNDEGVMIEHSAYCIGKIVDQLRLRAIATLDDLPPLPSILEHEKKNFERVVTYYFPGVEDFICPSSAGVTSDAITIFHTSAGVGGANTSSCFSGAAQAHVHAICKGILDPSKNPACWQVTIEAMGQWVFLGIINAQVPSTHSYNDPSAIGWSCSGQAWVCGANTATQQAGWIGWQVGDVATFKLTSTHLSMRLRRTGDTVYTLAIPTNLGQPQPVHGHQSAADARRLARGRAFGRGHIPGRPAPAAAPAAQPVAPRQFRINVGMHDANTRVSLAKADDW